MTKVPMDQDGFTLLELLSAIAIVSILMLIAIPVYSDYRSRAKVSEGLYLVGKVLSNVEETYRETGSWPEDNKSAGVAEPGAFSTKWVSAIVVEHDTDEKTQIRVVYNASSIGGLQPNDDIIFKPTMNFGHTVWDCTDGAIKPYFRPNRCKSSSS